jgi:hypothetical protein
MTLFIFLAALGVSAVLGHQRRRHDLELTGECDRRAMRMPDPPQPVPALESILTVLLGMALLVPSAAAFAAAFRAGDPRMWNPLWDIVSVGMASGAALLILGIRSLVRLRTIASKPADQIVGRSDLPS